MGTRVRRRYVELRLPARLRRRHFLCSSVLRSIRGKDFASIVEKMQQAAHAMCGANPASRVAKSVTGGFAFGFGVGAFKGFVTGDCLAASLV